MKFIFNDPSGNEHLYDNDPQNQSRLFIIMNPSTEWPPLPLTGNKRPAALMSLL